MLRPSSETRVSFTPSAATMVAAFFCAIILSFAVTQPARAQTFRVIHSFTGLRDGAYPSAGLTEDSSGNFYGSVPSGGTGCFTHGCGLVFKLTQTGVDWQFSPVHLFLGFDSVLGDGDGPGGLTFGPGGDLYGGTGSGSECSADPVIGCGTIFQLHATNCSMGDCPWVENLLYRFQGGNDAEDGSGTPVFDTAGNLYGTSEAGGGSGSCYGGCGTVYRLTPSSNGWTETVLHAFGFGNDGSQPTRNIVLDHEGNIYGTTTGGGLYGNGAVFELERTESGYAEQVLYNFRGGPDGSLPTGLIADQSGNLYGATSGGGLRGGGTVYELSPNGEGWNFRVIYSFAGGFGFEGPYAALFMDTTGNLYGTTWSDGPNNKGYVFKLSRGNDGWTFADLHDFTGGADGANPSGQLTMDAAGNLYGTTYDGGNPSCEMYGCGVVFEITP